MNSHDFLSAADSQSPLSPEATGLSRKSGRGPFAAHFALNRILEAATGVFAEKGVANTVVADILNAAGISRRTFYKYFKNKEDVLRGLHEIYSDHMLARIHDAVDQADDVLLKIRRGIDVFIESHATSGTLVRMLTQEATRSESPLAPGRIRFQQAIVDMFDREVQRAQGRRIDPLVYFAIVWALEGISIHLLTETSCGPADLEHAKAVMYGVTEHIIGNPNDSLTPLPERSA